MLLTLLLIWFVSAGDRRSAAPPHRARARDVAAPAARAGRVAAYRWRRRARCEPTRIDVQSEDEIGELAQAFNDVEAVTIEVARGAVAAAAQGHGRPVREPGAPQPEPARAAARAARRARAQRARPRRARRAVQARPHGDPHAPERREPARALRAPSSRGSGSSRSRSLDVVRAAAAEIADFPRVELVGIDDGLALSRARRLRRRPPRRRAARERDRRSRRPTPPWSCRARSPRPGSCSRSPTRASACRPSASPRRTRCSPSPPVVGLALSRALGLHVVGSLAARHGIAVELRAGATGGLVALVHLPTAVLEPRAVPAPPARRPRLRRARCTRRRSATTRRRAPRCASGRLPPARRAAGRAVAPRGLADGAPSTGAPARHRAFVVPPVDLVEPPVAPAARPRLRRRSAPAPAPEPAARARRPSPTPRRSRADADCRRSTSRPPSDEFVDRRRCPPGSRAST